MGNKTINTQAYRVIEVCKTNTNNMKNKLLIVILTAFIFSACEKETYTKTAKESSPIEVGQANVKHFTLAEERQSFIEFKLANPDYKIFETQAALRTSLQSEKKNIGAKDMPTYLYNYRCSSGFTWWSSSLYSECPFCGNPVTIIDKIWL